MNYNFTREEKLLQKSVREYLRDKILPIAGPADREAPIPKKAVHGLLKGLFPFGYIGSLAALTAGGPGLTHVESGIIFSELGKAWASLGAIALSTSNVISLLMMSQNKALIDRYLPRLLRGEIIGACAVAEPLAGTDGSAIQTTANLAGDHFVINGEKVWVANGTSADVILVGALIRESGKDEPAAGYILVDRSVSEVFAEERPKMGLKGLSTAKFIFDGCRVAGENMLGPLGMYSFSRSFLTDAWKNQLAAIAIGVAEAALDASISYAKQRVQFGKVLGEFQMIQKMIADMATALDAARLLCFRAMNLLDDGAICHREVEMAKAFALDMAVDVASKTIQIHGAYGYSDEFPVERFYRDAGCLALMDGDPNLARLDVAASLLGFSGHN